MLCEDAIEELYSYFLFDFRTKRGPHMQKCDREV